MGGKSDQSVPPHHCLRSSDRETEAGCTPGLPQAGRSLWQTPHPPATRRRSLCDLLCETPHTPLLKFSKHLGNWKKLNKRDSVGQLEELPALGVPEAGEKLRLFSSLHLSLQLRRSWTEAKLIFLAWLPGGPGTHTGVWAQSLPEPRAARTRWGLGRLARPRSPEAHPREKLRQKAQELPRRVLT